MRRLSLCTHRSVLHYSPLNGVPQHALDLPTAGEWMRVWALSMSALCRASREALKLSYIRCNGCFSSSLELIGCLPSQVLICVQDERTGRQLLRAALRRPETQALHLRHAWPRVSEATRLAGRAAPVVPYPQWEENCALRFATCLNVE